MDGNGNVNEGGEPWPSGRPASVAEIRSANGTAYCGIDCQTHGLCELVEELGLTSCLSDFTSIACRSCCGVSADRRSAYVSYVIMRAAAPASCWSSAGFITRESSQCSAAARRGGLKPGRNTYKSRTPVYIYAAISSPDSNDRWIVKKVATHAENFVKGNHPAVMIFVTISSKNDVVLVSAKRSCPCTKTDHLHYPLPTSNSFVVFSSA